MGARLNRKHLSLNSVAPEFRERRLSDFLEWGEDFFFNELYFRNTGWPLVHAQVIWASLSSATNELLICFLGLTRCKILGTAACVPSPRP